MRKLLCFAIFGILLFTNNAYSATEVTGCPINVTQVTYKGNQNPTDDEFVQWGPNIYECDSNYCKDGYSFTVTNPTADVYFKGNKIKTFPVTFTCYTMGNDRWKMSGGGNPSEPDRVYQKVCGVAASQVKWSGTQDQDDDEFLWGSGGKVYECDNEEGCVDGFEITMDAGHRFKGDIINKKQKYKCVAPKGWHNDRWEPVDTPAEKSQDQKDCEAAAARGEPANWNNNVCNCGDKMVWDTTQKKCIKQDPAVPTCKQKRSTTNGKACCDLSDSVASYDSKKDVCQCKGGKKFKIVNGKGVCESENSDTDPEEEPEEDPKVYKCPETILVWLRERLTDPKSTAETRTLAQEALKLCGEEAPKEDDVNVIIIQIRTVINIHEQEEKAKADEMISRSKQAIASAVNSIDELTQGLDVSVWRDAEGKFNTARLASDSIAAVVLGTTGGVVTSTVMKKHQVEDGFESLNCTIGGQTVAGWGDEFRVGVQ